ncbi:MAG: hypothetical protein IJ867_04395 [Clostridia bacterium]|nr:hypothetical protein [Clostridia bacterium]
MLTQASGASDTTKIAQMKEACGLAMSSVQAEYFNAYANNASSTPSSYINAYTIDQALSKQGYILCDGTTEVAASTAITNGKTYNIYAKPSTGTTGSGDHLAVQFTLNNFTITATYGNKLDGTGL